jgi:hypothetical protein
MPLDKRFMGSNPANNNRLLRAINIRSTPSFEGEVKLSAPCKISWHVKEPLEASKRYFAKQNSSYPLPSPHVLQQDDFAGRTAKELWLTNQEFPLLISFHHAGTLACQARWHVRNAGMPSKIN